MLLKAAWVWMAMMLECSICVLGRFHKDSLLLRRVPRSQSRSGEEQEHVRVESLHVESRIQHRYAQSLVSSRLSNPGNSSQQAKFSVLLPESAFITAFSLEVAGKVYRAFVKERQEAKHHYQLAVDQGLTAGHLSVSARDSHLLYVAVNLESGGRANFNLSYEQLLSRKLGLYSHVINLHPGQIVPDMSVVVHIGESQPLSKLSVLPFNSGGHVLVLPNMTREVWEGVTVERPGPSKATVNFTPSIETQQQLSAGEVEGEAEGLSGLLVICYDVEQPSPGGTVLVNEGYFVHLLVPGEAELPPLPKHVIFTLDVSGSMTGRKLLQLKEAMARILDDLEPHDHFNIIEFSYSVTVWNLDSLSSSSVFQPEIHSSGLWWFNKVELPSTLPPSTAPPPPRSVPPYPASPEYICKAKDVIDKMTPGGGTNIYGALKTAVLTAASTFRNITVNTSLKPEPIIIFLTDGDPTIGITDQNKILNMVKEYNIKQSAIFSLAFGDGADLSFLRRLSLANNGFARNIYEASDAAQQLRNFYREVASPLLSNVTFSYLPGQVIQPSVTSHHFHTLFLGSQVVVAGRLDKNSQVSGTVTAVTALGNSSYNFQSSGEPIDELSADLYGLGSTEEEDGEGEDSTPDLKERKRKRKKKTKGTLERLWAYLTIQQLLDCGQISDSEEVNKRVLDLALRYNFVTPVTSLVVIKPNQSVEIDQESLKPQSVRNGLYSGNLLQHTRPIPPRTHYEGTSSFMEESSTKKVILIEKVRNLTLQDIRWLEGLVDLENATVTLPLGVNGTNQQYRLGLDQKDWPLEVECMSPRSKRSHCRHLPHCVLPDILSSVSSYIRYYCPLPNGFAGICCPDTQNKMTTERAETTSEDTTTDTPSTTDYTTSTKV